MVIKNTKKISDSFMENISYMDRTLPVGKSFDLIKRTIEIGERKAVLYFIDGFVKDEAMLKLMDSFMGVTKEAMPKEAEMFSQRHVPYIEVDVLKDFDQVLRNVLSGVTCLFIEGYAACIAIDTRTYPARSVEEPDKDKSLRGSRDGFVETIVFNTALMRRRIRDEHLIMEMTEAGQTSRTDIVICYMSDRVDKELLANVKSRIESLHIDDLKMNTAIAALMAMVNEFYSSGLTRGDLRQLMLLLSPFAPHMVEEMWELTGYAAKTGKMAMQMPWPAYDEGKTVDTHVDMAIQVNGKLKGAVTVPAGSDQETVMAAAMELDKVRKAAEGMTVVKTILVKDKLMNLIVKPAK